MKTLKSFIILIAMVVLPGLLKAQQLTVDKPIAARGDTVKCTLIYKFTNDNQKCSSESRYFEVGPKDGVAKEVYSYSIDYVNDSTTNIEFTVPKLYSDGLKLNLNLRYVLGPFEEKPQTQLGCDSLFLANIVTVQGGDFDPTLTSITPSSFQRLDTVTATIGFKGFDFSGYTFLSLRIIEDRNSLEYSAPIQSFQKVNDSTMLCTFVSPYDIPNGTHRFMAEVSEWPFFVSCYNQKINITGGKPIPKIKSVSPKNISRGVRTNYQIIFESIKLKNLPKIPNISADWAKIDSVRIINDSTLSFTILLNTVQTANYVSLKIELYEGQTLLYQHLPIVEGKPQAYVKLDKTYILSLGQTDTLTLIGVNTSFKQGKLNLEFNDSLAGKVLHIRVLDSVTASVVVKINPEFEIRNSVAQYLMFSDDESPIKTKVGWAIILVSESTQNRWWKMEPAYFYKNSLTTYYFYLVNDSIRLKSPADRYSLTFTGINSLQEPEMSDCRRLNDSTIICQIRFQESFSDRFCTVDFRYNSTRVGLNIQSIGAVQMVSTGLEAINDKPSLWVYPNPTSGPITVNFKDQEFEPISIKVTNMAGKQLLEEQISSEKVSNFYYHLNIDNGLYIVELKTKEDIYLWKISIQK